MQLYLYLQALLLLVCGGGMNTKIRINGKLTILRTSQEVTEFWRQLGVV